MKEILKSALFLVASIDLIIWASRFNNYKNLNFEEKSRFVGNVVADILIIAIYVL